MRVGQLAQDGPGASPAGPRIAFSRRSSFSVIAAILRNPIRSLPQEVYDHSLVVSRIFGRTRVYICDPLLIHEALVKNADCLSKGPEIKRILGPALGNGLLTSDGAPWRWQRQSMAPTFQHDNLARLLPPMIAAAEQTRDRWLAPRAEASIDVAHEMMSTTFKIIVDTMLSGPGQIDADRVERCVTDYLKTANWKFALAILRAPAGTPHPGAGRAKAAATYMRLAVSTMVAQCRREAETRDDLVGLMLAAADPETGRMMSDEAITDNLLTFITAGHETTALGLGWTFQLLNEHPAIEAKVLEEIDRVTGREPVRPEHIERLTYTKQVFSEAMRLFPPAPMIVRTVEKPFALSGHAIAAGTMVAVPIYAVHRHRLIWDNPEAFDPDRFAPAAVKGRHRLAFMPFGAGHRICIGSAFATMEAVAVLAVILKAMRLRSDRPRPDALMTVTLRPMRKLTMHPARREAAAAAMPVF